MIEPNRADRPDGRGPARRIDPATLFDITTELGRDLAAVDWARTPLGPVSEWTPSLRNIVRLQLGSRFAMWMAWGPDLTFLCNDAYRRTSLGAKYPWALGKPAQQVWSEIWPDIGPRVESVIATGVATWDEGLQLFLERSGYQEETYHTFSYSPITDDSGDIRGMLCVVSEETARVISERRMATLRDLGTGLAAASTEAEVHAAARQQLGTDGHNLPFALGYLFDADRRQAQLAFAAGVRPGSTVAPLTLEAVSGSSGWPVDTVVAGAGTVVEDLDRRFADVPCGPWTEPVQTAVLVPFARPGDPQAFGFLVAGLNRYRELDSDYRAFVELVAGQIAAAITRARAFEQERQRAQDLAELDRAKTTFFTNVSHELRTPLTLLLGPAADALSDRGEPLPDTQRERVEVVQRNAERLLKLVNTLLDFSRMEAGQVRTRFEPVDLARYTTELAAMFDSAVERAGLELHIDCPPLPDPVYVDREMWAKIVLNLLSNALKATFTGSIRVALHEVGGQAELTVTDTGTGIPAEEQHRLFERFQRVSGARLRSHEGSGIGLALVSELAGLHGGTVAVRSAPDQGSTFTVRVPFGAGHLPAEETVDEQAGDAAEQVPASRFGAGYLAEASRWLVGAQSTPAVAPGRDLRPLVLVVDDNADMRDYVTGLLSGDYALVTATNGLEALQQVRVALPDLVLTDVMMPQLDGFGLLTALRADPATMHIPVVMLSARSGDDATIEGLEAGADDYLVKPFAARELLARVRANLELDRVRRLAAELTRSRELLDQAEELAHVGSWEIDLRDNSITASPEFFRILGVEPDRLSSGGLELALRSVQAEDRRRVEAALAETAAGGAVLDLELRVVHADGQRRLVAARGRLHRGAPTDPGYIRGSAQDITDQRSAELAVAAEAAAREGMVREHAIAEELQRSLLPASTFRAEHLDVAAYYVAGVEGTQAGGDWYDLIDLGQGRSALVIGDVMGRGVRAAAVMGQLRATVQAYARLGLPPGPLLEQLDAAVADMGEPTIVTCVYAVHDPVSGTLTYGNAGHLPPLLSRPGSPTRRLPAGDPPLGTGQYRGHVETVSWLPGDRLTMYTDGLVEHRGTDLDLGIDQLTALLDSALIPVEALPNAVAEVLLPHEPDDDVAILVADVRALQPTSELAVSLPATSASVGPARAAAATVLADLGVDGEVAADALLVVSELVSNAVLYGSAPIELRIRRERADLVIMVSDGEVLRPTMRAVDPSAVGGRGLQLVAALSSRWGTRPTGAGKSVWCTIGVPGDRMPVG